MPESEAYTQMDNQLNRPVHLKCKTKKRCDAAAAGMRKRRAGAAQQSSLLLKLDGEVVVHLVPRLRARQRAVRQLEKVVNVELCRAVEPARLDP